MKISCQQIIEFAKTHPMSTNAAAATGIAAMYGLDRFAAEIMPEILKGAAKTATVSLTTGFITALAVFVAKHDQIQSASHSSNQPQTPATIREIAKICLAFHGLSGIVSATASGWMAGSAAESEATGAYASAVLVAFLLGAWSGIPTAVVHAELKNREIATLDFVKGGLLTGVFSGLTGYAAGMGAAKAGFLTLCSTVSGLLSKEIYLYLRSHMKEKAL